MPLMPLMPLLMGRCLGEYLTQMACATRQDRFCEARAVWAVILCVGKLCTEHPKLANLCVLPLAIAVLLLGASSPFAYTLKHVKVEAGVRACVTIGMPAACQKRAIYALGSEGCGHTVSYFLAYPCERD